VFFFLGDTEHSGEELEGDPRSTTRKDQDPEQHHAPDVQVDGG